MMVSTVILWAQSHRLWAIGLFILLKALVSFLAFHGGVAAAMMSYILPADPIGWFLGVLALFVAWTYPPKALKNRLGREAFYYRRKAADFALVVICTALWFLLGNRISAPLLSTIAQSDTSSVMSTGPVVLGMLPKGENPATLKPTRSDERTAKTRTIKQRWNNFKLNLVAKAVNRVERVLASVASDHKEPLEVVVFRILLTLLAIALFGAILYGIAVLSCMLACNGADSLAVLLLAIGGTVGDIFLLVYLLKVIFKKREHPNP